MSKIKLVCFDIDETLVDGNSWLILTEGLGCSTQKHLDIYTRAKKKTISFAEAERALTKMYQDSGKANHDFIKNIFSKIKPRKYAKEVIDYLRNKGYKVYLITGGLDVYAESIAKKLNADGFYANSTLEFDGDGLLKKIHYRDNQGQIKVEQAKELIEKLGINIDEVAFIGDSDNDVEIFKETQHGIAVHCEHKDLKKAAWKTAEKLKDIKNIL